MDRFPSSFPCVELLPMKDGGENITPLLIREVVIVRICYREP